MVPLVEDVREVAGGEEVVGGDAERDDSSATKATDDAEVANLDLDARWRCVAQPAVRCSRSRSAMPPCRRFGRECGGEHAIHGRLRARRTRRRSAPRRMTSTRCASPSTSSSSEEIRSTAIPSPPAATISSWIWRLAPTSTPRVGSSAISTRGVLRKPFREQRFLLVAARQRGDRCIERAGADVELADEFARAPVLAAPVDEPARSKGRPASAKVTFSRTGRIITRPCSLRLSGSIAMPCRAA